MWNREVGKKGELLAEQFFLDRGYTFLERNYRTPYGELDLVFKKDNEVIFIEVKTRTGQEFGYGESSVDEGKLEHLVSSAEHYMSCEAVDTDSWRIDVLAIELKSENHDPDYEWFENVN
jgi:putative endonuclease